MEQREANVEVKALSLISEFAKKFRSIDFTLHPSDIPGESAGKGSNVAWAARKLSEKYTLPIRKDVVITGIDGECPSGGSVLLHAVYLTVHGTRPIDFKDGAGGRRLPPCLAGNQMVRVSCRSCGFQSAAVILPWLLPILDDPCC